MGVSAVAATAPDALSYNTVRLIPLGLKDRSIMYRDVAPGVAATTRTAHSDVNSPRPAGASPL